MKKHLDDPSSHLDQETRRQILTVAKDLFFAKGYKGVSMREIADAVQVTQAGLYYHFPKGKEELFTKMIQILFVDEGELRTDIPVGALVSLYMGMLREAKSSQASQVVAVLLDGIASPAQRDQA